MSANGKTKTLYVAGLDPSITDSALKAEFSKFATIERVTIIKDKATRESKGFGYVVVASFDDAPAAMKEMDGRVLADKPIKVKFSFSEAPEWQSILDSRRGGDGSSNFNSPRGRGNYTPRGGRSRGGYPNSGPYRGESRPNRGGYERGNGMSRGRSRPMHGYGDQRGSPRNGAPSYREREPIRRPDMNGDRESSSEMIGRNNSRPSPMHRSQPPFHRNPDYKSANVSYPESPYRKPTPEFPTRQEYGRAQSDIYPERRSVIPRDPYGETHESPRHQTEYPVKRETYGTGYDSDPYSRKPDERLAPRSDPVILRSRPQESTPLYARESAVVDRYAAPREERLPRRDLYDNTARHDSYPSERPIISREQYSPASSRLAAPMDRGGYAGYGNDFKDERSNAAFHQRPTSGYDAQDY